MRKWYSNDDIRIMILTRLQEEPVLDGFILRKTWEGLYMRDRLGWYEISIANSRPSVDLQRDSQLSLCVKPGYGRRFNVNSAKHSP